MLELITLEMAKEHEEIGNIKLIASEKIPFKEIYNIDSYLKDKAVEFGSDVVGVPNKKTEEYFFYKTNKGKTISMPNSNDYLMVA